MTELHYIGKLHGTPTWEYEKPIRVFFDLSGTRRLGHVVRINSRTTWVKVMKGARSYDYIKRHNEKHRVTRYCGEETPYETVHTTIRHKVIFT
jgi:hypothetical protein